MSYLEYNAKTTPSGLRKILYLNWPLIVLLTSVASIGFLMLYSVAGGSYSPWVEPQVKRFFIGLVAMVGIAMVPIWFWRNMAVVAYLTSIALLLAVEAVPPDEFLVARVDPLPPAALAVVKGGLGDVLDRNGHLPALLDVHDLPAGHRLRYRLAYLFAVALDEALLVDGTLVAAVLAPIDDRGHMLALV